MLGTVDPVNPLGSFERALHALIAELFLLPYVNSFSPSVEDAPFSGGTQSSACGVCAMNFGFLVFT